MAETPTAPYNALLKLVRPRGGMREQRAVSGEQSGEERRAAKRAERRGEESGEESGEERRARGEESGEESGEERRGEWRRERRGEESEALLNALSSARVEWPVPVAPR